MVAGKESSFGTGCAAGPADCESLCENGGESLGVVAARGTEIGLNIDNAVDTVESASLGLDAVDAVGDTESAADGKPLCCNVGESLGLKVAVADGGSLCAKVAKRLGATLLAVGW